MKLIAVSDLHLQNNENSIKYFKDLTSEIVSIRPNKFLMLGDIFDLLVGEKKQYLQEYSWFFSCLKRILESKIQVVFIEGNHDFHLASIFQHFISIHKIEENLFKYEREIYHEKIKDVEYYFMHGDQIDFTNLSYSKWKKIYTSNQFKFVLNKFIPHLIIRLAGSIASKNSRKRSAKNFDENLYRKKYLNNVSEILKSYPENSVIIAGHTHLREDVYFGKKRYINLGLPLKDKSFLLITEDELSFQYLA
jgi:UDP-2,3-diacylglucosamine hydrolase